MFGVKRWGGAGVHETSGEEAQARLEAWKKKAKEREEAKRREGQRDTLPLEPGIVGAKSKSSSQKVKSSSKEKANGALRSANRQLESREKRVAKDRSNGSGRKASEESKAKLEDNEEKLPPTLNPPRAVNKQPDGAQRDGKGGTAQKGLQSTASVPPVKSAVALQEQSVRKAVETARAEKRELKRRKEVERAHEIIAKKAKKHGKAIAASPDVQPVDVLEEDEEKVKEERRLLKRQKREERSRRKQVGALEGAGKEQLDVRATALLDVAEPSEPETGPDNEALAGTEHENISEDSKGEQRTAAIGEAPAEPAEHHKRKRRKAGGEAVDAGEQVVPESEVGEASEEGEHRKRRKQKPAPAEANPQEPSSQSPLRVVEHSEGGAVDGHTVEAPAGPIKTPEPVLTKGPPLLPWMRAPIEIGEDEGLELSLVPGLDPRLRSALEKSGVAGLFPVQAAVWREMVSS